MRRIALFLAALVAISACASRPVTSADLLAEYSRTNGTRPLIAAETWVEWLKSDRFPNGELDALPKVAIFMHHALMEERLRALGYDNLRELRLGQTDPAVVWIVTPREGAPFLVARGMPGAGGVATQTAELGALGITKMIHIGTCGSLTPGLTEAELIVSNGSWKDGAAVLLASDDAPISRPDPTLTSEILGVLAERNLKPRKLTGFTSPIFYHQPEALTLSLVHGRVFAQERPGFVEMEQAPFFETCRRQSMQCASIVVASDEWKVGAASVDHHFIGDTTPAELIAFDVARNALTR